MKERILNMETRKEKQNRPCDNESLTEKLDDWAWKLEALGGIIGALCWHEKNTPLGGTIALTEYGEAYGQIIIEYADLIRTAVCENVGEKNAQELISRLGEACELLKNSKSPNDIYIIDMHLQQLDSLIANLTAPALELKNSFESIKKNLMAGGKKAA